MNKFASFTNNDLWHYIYSNTQLCNSPDGRELMQELSVRLYGMNALYDENMRMRAVISEHLAIDDDQIDEIISSMVEVEEDEEEPN